MVNTAITKSPLRTALFSVTPLSKTLALILFLLLPISMLYLGIVLGRTASSMAENMPIALPQPTQNPTFEKSVKSVYVNTDYQFSLSVPINTTCLTQQNPLQDCFPIRFSDSAIAGTAAPVFSLVSDDIRVQVYASPNTVRGSNLIGTTVLKGKQAVVYYHYSGEQYEGRHSEDEYWIAVMPVGTGRWLYITLPRGSEGIIDLTEPLRTIEDFLAVWDTLTNAENTILHSLRFLDATSVSTDASNWPLQQFEEYTFRVPREATVSLQGTTALISFQSVHNSDSENTIYANMYSYQDIMKNGETDIQAGLEKMYGITNVKPKATQLSPTLSLYIYGTVEQHDLQELIQSSRFYKNFFLIDSEREQVIEIKHDLEDHYLPTFEAILKSVQ